MKSLWSNLGTVLCAVELCTKSASAGSGPVHSESNARGCFQMLSLSSLGHQCCALGFFDSGSVGVAVLLVPRKWHGQLQHANRLSTQLSTQQHIILCLSYFKDSL